MRAGSEFPIIIHIPDFPAIKGASVPSKPPSEGIGSSLVVLQLTNDVQMEEAL
jgi:hypothetical protein